MGIGRYKEKRAAKEACTKRKAGGRGVSFYNILAAGSN
jgi:hypothetical protein